MIQMQKGPLMATVYKDKRQIYMLSTNQPPGMTTVGDKRTPTVIAAYNKNMGGVDKSDQHRAYYPANKKWWRYIFHSLVNLSLVQAFLTWEKSCHNPVLKKGYDHLMFRADVAEQLRGGFSGRKRSARRTKATPEPTVAMDTIRHHKLIKIEGRKKVCRMRVKVGRKTTKGWQVETSYQCCFCKVPLCHHNNDCFRDYHSQVSVVSVTPSLQFRLTFDDNGDNM